MYILCVYKKNGQFRSRNIGQNQRKNIEYPIDVVVDVEDKRDDGANEGHVADGVGSGSDALTFHVLTFLSFRLELKKERSL
jgi:hypothetical protein